MSNQPVNIVNVPEAVKIFCQEIDPLLLYQLHNVPLTDEYRLILSLSTEHCLIKFNLTDKELDLKVMLQLNYNLLKSLSNVHEPIKKTKDVWGDPLIADQLYEVWYKRKKIVLVETGEMLKKLNWHVHTVADLTFKKKLND